MALTKQMARAHVDVWSDQKRRVDAHEAEIVRLRTELSAACGYMRNARIDLETGTPKRTAIQTLDSGLKRAEAALSEQKD